MEERQDVHLLVQGQQEWDLGDQLGDDLLTNVIWHRIKSAATRRSFYFQQDRATPNTTRAVMEWLKDRVISRFMEIPWPAKIPDLSPLDF